MRAILQAPVDLLYNGGIGTYVKAARETHLQVGDRANDASVSTARELRCKVVAEGGNLGLTQTRAHRVRAERRPHQYRCDRQLRRGRCSDHEVNIKILLGLVVSDGEMTEKQRNALLAEMTDEVGLLVLAGQLLSDPGALDCEAATASKLLDAEARLMRYLERAGRLNRVIECLPTDEEVAERQAAKQGLTTPERRGAACL